jgi:hypothetical protein
MAAAGNMHGISDEEVKSLMKVPPSNLGIALTLVLFGVHANSFSIYETMIGPIVCDISQTYSDTLNGGCNIIYLSCGVMAFLICLGT